MTRLDAVRFTASGDAALELLIAEQLSGIRCAVLARLPAIMLDALVLGGGYGRGEGGALGSDGAMRPYNDYDLVLVHHFGSTRALGSALDGIHLEQSAHCGIHVDVTPIHRKRIRRLPPALTWYEFGQGHRVLWGNAALLDPLKLRRLQDVHPTEWGRLLLNRGCGLLFARWLLDGYRTSVAGNEDVEEFVTRQVFKAWLSLGDVWLADRGEYDCLVQERLRRLKAAGQRHQTPAWCADYAAAVEFKLRPRLRVPVKDLEAYLARLLPLYSVALSDRSVARARPWVALDATIRRISPRRWLRSNPLRYPRERLRLAVTAELAGLAGSRERLIGSREDLVQLWGRYG